ncbi:Spy/CpxP family protein refolding chaperone [Pseudaminobacter soli (ex Li et al. 2025)]|nr:Spy/CpxP family protein refolding chaperone [Mesorhizobium soli]
MLRAAIVGVTALLISSSTLAYAQTAAPTDAQGASNDWKELTDVRIDLIKAALQLTPEQQKLWPAVESAIRARAEVRRDRIENLQKMRSDQPDFFDILRNRANNMAQRANGLKQYADAWEPLYKTLDDKQKARLRFVAMLAAHEAREWIAEEGGGE